MARAAFERPRAHSARVPSKISDYSSGGAAVARRPFRPRPAPAAARPLAADVAVGAFRSRPPRRRGNIFSPKEFSSLSTILHRFQRRAVGGAKSLSRRLNTLMIDFREPVRAASGGAPCAAAPDYGDRL